MKKYFVLIASAFLFWACGNATNDVESDSMETMTEEEQIFVEQETDVIEESVLEVKNKVEHSEQQVEELLRDI